MLDVVEDDRNGPTVTDQHALARPIGWWLKEANTRLDAAFDDALQNTGVDRRGWQVLDSLARGPVSRAELVDSLAAFDPTESLQLKVDDVLERGWLAETDGVLQLTESGVRQHAAVAPLVGRVRERVRTVLPQDDYVTLVRLLARLTEAL